MGNDSIKKLLNKVYFAHVAHVKELEKEISKLKEKLLDQENKFSQCEKCKEFQQAFKACKITSNKISSEQTKKIRILNNNQKQELNLHVSHVSGQQPKSDESTGFRHDVKFSKERPLKILSTEQSSSSPIFVDGSDTETPLILAPETLDVEVDFSERFANPVCVPETLESLNHCIVDKTSIKQCGKPTVEKHEQKSDIVDKETKDVNFQPGQSQDCTVYITADNSKAETFPLFDKQIQQLPGKKDNSSFGKIVLNPLSDKEHTLLDDDILTKEKHAKEINRTSLDTGDKKSTLVLNNSFYLDPKTVGCVKNPKTEIADNDKARHLHIPYAEMSPSLLDAEMLHGENLKFPQDSKSPEVVCEEKEILNSKTDNSTNNTEKVKKRLSPKLSLKNTQNSRNNENKSSSPAHFSYVSKKHSFYGNKHVTPLKRKSSDTEIIKPSPSPRKKRKQSKLSDKYSLSISRRKLPTPRATEESKPVLSQSTVKNFVINKPDSYKDTLKNACEEEESYQDHSFEVSERNPVVDFDETFIPTKFLCNIQQSSQLRSFEEPNVLPAESLHSKQLLSPKSPLFLDRLDCPLKGEVTMKSPLSPKNTNRMTLADDFKEGKATKAGKEIENPEKSDLPYKYFGSPVRKKEDRKKLTGYGCKDCDKFYSAVGIKENEKKQMIQKCSRHRAHYAPPDTPEHFWEIDFPDTPECKARGYMKETQKCDLKLKK